MNTTKTTQTFPVLDMSCAACATRVEKTLNRQPGVYHAQVNYAAATATVEYNPQECTPETLKDAIQNAGYDLVIETNAQKEKIAEDAHSRKYRQLKQRTIFSLMLSVPVAIIGMCFMDWTYANYVMWILSTPLVFWLGRDFYRNAWKQLKHRTSNMDTLVAVSTGIAYTFSLFNLFWPEFYSYSRMSVQSCRKSRIISNQIHLAIEFLSGLFRNSDDFAIIVAVTSFGDTDC